MPLPIRLRTLLDTAYTTLGLALLNAPAGPGRDYILNTASYGAQPWQHLDVYTPPGAAADNDVIVFLYGGRWSSGSRSMYRFVGHCLARHGYKVVIPDYSQYPAVKFPLFVQDGALAVQYAVQQLKPKRLFVAGHSAGAHIGALLAINPEYNVRQHITAFAGLAGPYCFTPDEDDLKDIFGPPELYPLMQAPTYVDGKQPPLLLQYGLKDTVVGAFNHEKLATQVAQRGGSVDIKTYPGAHHVDMVTAFAWPRRHRQVVTDMIGFFAGQPDHK